MSFVLILSTPRWHSWIARLPPKEQVEGSNPSRGAILIRVRTVVLDTCLTFYTGDMVYTFSGVTMKTLKVGFTRLGGMY